MKGKIGILIMGLVIAGMVVPLSTIPNTVKAAPPLFYCWIVAPSVGWENEAITFSAGVYGGMSPYSFRWDWTNDGTWDTGWSNSSVQHTYSPTVSPTTYTVRMEGRDGSNPIQYNNATKTMTIYKDYDIAANVQWQYAICKEGNPDNIYCDVTLESETLPAPGFDWSAQCIIVNYSSGATVKTFPVHYGTTLNSGNLKDDWTETWESPTVGLYRAYLTITAGHDSYSSNNRNYDGVYVYHA